MIYVQGDVLLFKCEKPSNVTKLKSDLLHKGQQNHHRIKGKFMIADGVDNIRYVHSKGCTLFHEEHGDIYLPEGFYRLGIALEYSHQEEEARNVID